jgi:hypothetical protein
VPRVLLVFLGIMVFLVIMACQEYQVATVATVMQKENLEQKELKVIMDYEARRVTRGSMVWDLDFLTETGSNVHGKVLKAKTTDS